MKKLSLISLALCMGCSVYAKDINVQSLVNAQSLNCELPNPMLNFIGDFYANGYDSSQFNPGIQRLKLGKNNYRGIQGYQHYTTAHMEQNDFAVNFEHYGVRVIKISLQRIRGSDTESAAYYFVFAGAPVTVTYQLRKALGSVWNIENSLEQTPQGNTKLTCIYG
ncbi:hypothetical protein EC844_107133 [Acinetobacter calcoaceticus]|uniref:Uncharacterized protein n=1 Tax=Acinetobacter calcoaceticus TaxID=471 RepID=A0A4V2R1A7_ACICA|nr:hypothetical protein EC844_107133 [Acinetobacter calcoaceticus]